MSEYGIGFTNLDDLFWDNIIPIEVTEYELKSYSIPYTKRDGSGKKGTIDFKGSIAIRLPKDKHKLEFVKQDGVFVPRMVPKMGFPFFGSTNVKLDGEFVSRPWTELFCDFTVNATKGGIKYLGKDRAGVLHLPVKGWNHPDELQEYKTWFRKLVAERLEATTLTSKEEFAAEFIPDICEVPMEYRHHLVMLLAAGCDLSEEDIQFMIDQVMKEGEWTDGSLYVPLPSYVKDGEAKPLFYAVNCRGHNISKAISDGLASVALALRGDYWLYTEPRTTLYGDSVIRDGCYGCDHCIWFTQGETGEIPEYGLERKKMHGITITHRTYCSKLAKPVMVEATRLYNESMYTEEESIVLYSKAGKRYETTIGRGKVLYGNSVVGLTGLRRKEGHAEKCVYHSSSQYLSSGTYWKDTAPSPIFHQVGEEWVLGKPGTSYKGPLGFLAGGQVLLIVKEEGMVQTILKKPTIMISPPYKVIPMEGEKTLFQEWSEVVYLGMNYNFRDLEGKSSPELILLMACDPSYGAELAMVPDSMKAELFEEVVEFLGVTDPILIDYCYECIDPARETVLPLIEERVAAVVERA